MIFPSLQITLEWADTLVLSPTIAVNNTNFVYFKLLLFFGRDISFRDYSAVLSIELEGIVNI